MRTRFLSVLAMAWALMLGAGVLNGCRDDGDDEGTGGDGDSDSDGDGDGDGDGDSDADDNSCRFVDVVIAVDGSGSMEEELDAMRTTVFPAFAGRLGAIADGLDDFRVATLDACPNPADFHTRGVGGACAFEGGNVWINSISQTVNQEFACVGDIYLADARCSGDNDDEQPASAVVAALEPPYGTGANAGFLRDEALLVVIAITDEDEQSTSMSNAQEIFDRLVAIKGGDPQRMVFLGIGGSQRCPAGEYGDAQQAQVLRELTGLFEDHDRGVWWDLCAGRLEDGLEEAFDVIQVACEEFDPPVV